MSRDTQVLPFTLSLPTHALDEASVARSAAGLLAGNSPAVVQLRAQLRRVAPYYRTVALCGEPGCGEAAVARTLHALSPLHELPFTELSAEAAERHFGRNGIAQAGPTEGTLFLSDPLRLSRAAQNGLLNRLRERSTHRLRVIVFTGQGLRALVSAGSFAADLAHQLEGLRIQLVPLRERPHDIEPLLAHILRQYSSPAQPQQAMPELSRDFIEAATQYPWPGNFTQLEAAVRWLLDRGQNSAAATQLHSGDLMEAIEALAALQGAAAAGPRMVRLELVLQEHIRSVLIGCNGNKLRAAEVLGISRSTLYRMLESQSFEADWPMAG